MVVGFLAGDIYVFLEIACEPLNNRVLSGNRDSQKRSATAVRIPYVNTDLPIANFDLGLST